MNAIEGSSMLKQVCLADESPVIRLTWQTFGNVHM
jgi:hypothetical protein